MTWKRLAWIGMIIMHLSFMTIPVQAEESTDEIPILFSSLNPSYQVHSEESLYSILYAIFPKEVWKQHVDMSRAYANNPNTLYQEVYPLSEQYLYDQVTRTLEPFLARSLVAKSRAFSVIPIYATPQAELSAEKDEYGWWTTIRDEAMRMVYP